MYYTTGKHQLDLCGIALPGRVLDIGGGGEGIMARHLGDGVIVIDKRWDELEESPDVGIKIIMDGCDLQFLDNTFDNATYFYSLMYMNEENAAKSLREAWRVLKPGGHLWIWDATIPRPAAADVFLVPLEIKLADEVIQVTYGVSWLKEQSLQSVAAMCGNAGFVIAESMSEGPHFFLKAAKLQAKAE